VPRQKKYNTRAEHAGEVANKFELFPEQVAEIEKLTLRELDVIALLARGYTRREISEELHISPHTVKTHLKHCLEKSGCERKEQVIVLFTMQKLLQKELVITG